MCGSVSIWFCCENKLTVRFCLVFSLYQYDNVCCGCCCGNDAPLSTVSVSTQRYAYWNFTINASSMVCYEEDVTSMEPDNFNQLYFIVFICYECLWWFWCLWHFCYRRNLCIYAHMWCYICGAHRRTLRTVTLR